MLSQVLPPNMAFPHAHFPIIPRSMTSIQYLPEGYMPSEYDVICGRGKECFEHVGNRRYRVTIDINLNRYAEAKTKLQKSVIVMSIVDQVKGNSPFGGFIKKDSATGKWYRVTDNLAREKVGQSLREALLQLNPQTYIEKKIARAQMRARKKKEAASAALHSLRKRQQAKSSLSMAEIDLAESDSDSDSKPRAL